MRSRPSLGAEQAMPPLDNTVPRASEGAKPWQSVAKPAGYGLPCSGCRTYYSADLPACPVCNNRERIEAAASSAAATAPEDDPCPGPDVLERERERFLREFKAQLLASQAQPLPAAKACCVKTENHLSDSETAAVCQSCYSHLQQRVDVMEAALHIDIKEAAQIVYDAVWADSSDSGKSYENAASALLNELRKRSGVTPAFGLMKPVTD
jgi:hypothetical protein